MTMRGGERTGGLNRRTCAQQSTHTCEEGPFAVRHQFRRKAKDVCGLYKSDTSFRWGVGVRKVRIDRLLTRVTCAFLGTLDPGYTHGNRPHDTSAFSLSPLSRCPPFPSCPRFSFPYSSERGGAFIIFLGGFEQSSKSMSKYIIPSRALNFLCLPRMLRNIKSSGNIEVELQNLRKKDRYKCIWVDYFTCRNTATPILEPGKVERNQNDRTFILKLSFVIVFVLPSS